MAKGGRSFGYRIRLMRNPYSEATETGFFVETNAPLRSIISGFLHGGVVNEEDDFVGEAH